MLKNYAILPCNGLDKCAGVISGEIAKRLCAGAENEMICPVFYRASESRYNKMANERPLLVIDGCQTRCASKLAAEKNLKVSRKLIITEEAKNHGIELKSNLRLQDQEKALVESILKEVTEGGEKVILEPVEPITALHFEYEIYQFGKFLFRVPSNPGIYFTENDCWAYIYGNHARIGVTDYVQQNLSDILYFTPPEIGDEIDQFGEAGDIESSKSVFELISPVGGKVVAINEELVKKPEMINENPYEKGWMAELELTDFESDKELLIGFEEYLELMKRKVQELNG